VNVTAQFFKKLFHESRLNYVLDLLFLSLMTGALLSGLLISESVLAFFGIHLEPDPVWRGLHHSLSDASVAVLGLHLALHWKWIVSNLNRYVFQPVVRFSGSARGRLSHIPTFQLSAVPIRQQAQETVDESDLSTR
jgi:hypothetical protein